MAETPASLTSAIDRWHFDAATHSKASSTLRSSMQALAGHIDAVPSALSAVERARLQHKLASVAGTLRNEASEAKQAAERHVSVFG